MSRGGGSPHIIHDFDSEWADLQISLTDIFDGRRMNMERFMKLYNHVCKMCLEAYENLRLQTTELQQIDGRNRRQLEDDRATEQSQQIYEKLKQLIMDNVSRIFEQCENMSGLDLLSIYDKNWKDFQERSKVVDHLCSYLNRNCIKKEQDKGNENVNSIHELCFLIWKDVFHRTDTESRVTNAILDLIHQERTGSNINCDIIKGVLQSYVMLNIRDDVYIECFENKFLQTTTDYYRAKARKINASPRVEYGNTVDKWITDEAARCAHYLDPTTEPKLCKMMEKILIKPFFLPRVSCQIQCKQFFDEGFSDDWARIHSLIEHDDELVKIQEALEQDFIREGHEAIERAKETIGQDTTLYVAKLHEVIQQQSDLVKQAFNNHDEAIGALDKAAKIYVNKNAVTTNETLSLPTNKSSEMLAKYCDQLLKKSVRTDAKFDALLDQAVVLFKYLEDTDTFFKFYTQLLSERLIDETSVETENSFIGKLISLCGSEYNRHMCTMMNDAQISKDLTSDFRQAMSAQNNDLLAADFHQAKSNHYYELPDFRVTVANNDPQCVHVGNDGMPDYSSKKLEDLRTVTREFKVLWKQLCNAQNMDIKLPSAYPYETSGIARWVRLSSVLKESYRIVYYTAVVKLVEKMALLKCDGYSHFLRLFDLVVFISQSAIASMQTEMFNCKESREYFTLFKSEYKDAECTHALLTLLRLLPALPLVVCNLFPKIIPQTVTVELPPKDVADKSFNWLLECLLNLFGCKFEKGRHLYCSKRQGFVPYTSVKTLCSSDIEQPTFLHCLPYLQPVNKLSDKDLADVLHSYPQYRPKIETNTFYEKIFEECSEIKFLHGEQLYALADHLRSVKEIRDSFPGYSERACEMLCEEMNSTLDFGSLHIYYHVLKKYLSENQVERLEKKLRQRQQAEQTFLEYFYDPQANHVNIRKLTEDYSYVFFLSFVKVFLFYTQTDQGEDQQQCINRLVDTLESFPKLKNLLANQKITPDKYFHEVLYSRLTTSKKHLPLDQLKRICSNDWGKVLTRDTQVGFKSYEASSRTIIRPLWKGGQGIVELVKVPGLPVPVVAKFFDVSDRASGEAFKEMKEEIRSLLSTQCHPHVVSLYGYIVKNHQIVGTLMELCKGGSLYSVIEDLKRQFYTESSIITWSLHASSGLRFIHENNIIHRDVKPENMLLNEEHKLLKIGDLGTTKLCKIASTILLSNYTNDRGTPGYMSPEMLEGKEYSSKVDTFALGRSIWSMIVRCEPSRNGPLDETLEKEVPVSSEIWECSERMMEVDPEKRSTMAEVNTFFEGQLNRLPTQSDPTGDITTQPASKLIFNAPFDNKLTYPFKITNTTVNYIGWTFESSNMKHLSAEPSCGRLGPNEAAMVAVSCGPFVYGQRGNDDCIVIVWTNVSKDDAKEFWFQDDEVVRKKTLFIEYNS